MPIFLGLDCGGSSCRAMAIDELGEPVFLAQGGSANLASTPEVTLDRSLKKALDGVPQVDVVCACFAGLISEDRRDQAIQLLRPLLPGAKLRVEPDYAAALRACPPETTVCVIAGTGSIVCSRVGDRLVRSGGGGFILGDEGSGFRYGRAALRRFLDDPASASEQLRHAIEYLLETLDPMEATLRIYRAPHPAALLAGLATALLKDAQAKEPYALLTLAGESSALADVAAKHAENYHFRAPSLSEHSDDGEGVGGGVSWPTVFGLAGGLWKRALFRDAFEGALRRKLPQARIVRSVMPPVRGAALLAMEAYS